MSCAGPAGRRRRGGPRRSDCGLLPDQAGRARSPCSRPTTSWAASAAPSSGMAGASTSAATGSSPRSPVVEDLWHEILPDEDFLQRPRMSRIYYDEQALRLPAARLERAGQPRDRRVDQVRRVLPVGEGAPAEGPVDLEGWVAARFGWRLYRTFFKTYTEKLWGMPASRDARRTGPPSGSRTSRCSRPCINALLPKRNQTDITSLIEQFQYPKFGPGNDVGARARPGARRGRRDRDGARGDGDQPRRGGATAVVSSAARRHEVDDARACRDQLDAVAGARAWRCSLPRPDHVLARRASAHPPRLPHRRARRAARSASFPDNWIYIHSPAVQVGRIQNFGSWSPYLVKDGRTCLGLEYFVVRGRRVVDHGRRRPRGKLAEKELIALGLARAGEVEASYVVRMPKAYPVYDEGYGRGRRAPGRGSPRSRRTSIRSAATACTSTTTRTTR